MRDFCVGDGKACCGVSHYLWGIAWDLILFDCVDNLSTICFVLVQAREGTCPVASLIKSECLPGINTIRKKTYRYRTCLRSNPLFFNRNIYLLGIGVGNSEAWSDIAGDGVSVVGNVILFDGVGNSCTVFVLRKIAKGSCPVASFVQSYGLAGVCAVSQKMYGDRVCFRSNPSLGYFDNCGFRGVGVCDVGTCYGWSVTIHWILRDSVGNLCSCGIVLIKTVKAVLPVTWYIRGNCLWIYLSAILQKIDGNGGGTLTILVVIVVPCLGARNTDLLGIGVGDGKACCGIACNGNSIFWHVNTGNRCLSHRIRNRRAIFIFWKIAKSTRPVTSCIQRQCFTTVATICKEFHGNGRTCRTNPLFSNRNGRDLRCMRVGNGISTCRITGNRWDIAGNRWIFLYGIGNCLTCSVLLI